jgi:hypothetical protein
VRKTVALFTIWAMAIGVFVVVSQSTSSSAPLPAFSGYSTGSNIHAEVLRVSDVQEIADVDVASSAAAVNSAGFPAGGIHNEVNFAVVPTPGAPDPAVDSAGKESYGRGSGLEVGVGTGLPNDDLNQVVPGGIAEAGAQPAERSDSDPVAGPTDSGDVQTELVEITQGDPLLYAQLLEGQARARFDETQCLTTGNLSEGRGQTAKAQLVDTSSDPATGDLDAPLVNASSDFFGSQRGVNETKSFTYLVDNLDGTWGLASETHMTFAPVGLLQTDPTAPAPVYVEILGEWIFRAVATGKAGGADVSYEVAGLSDDPDPTVIRVYLGAPNNATTPTIAIHRSQLFGDQGIDIAIPDGVLGPKLISLTLGEDIRAISAPNVLPDPLSDPTETGNGTLASGAADVVRISAVNADAGVPNGPEVANVRIGHLEAKAEVPAGGIVCPDPPATTTTTAGATTTTTAGATTTTSTTAATTTTTIPTSVAGVQITRSASPPADPVTAQPRFTG